MYVYACVCALKSTHVCMRLIHVHVSLSHTHTHTLSLSLSLSLSLPRYEDGVGGEGRDVGKGEEITV
jgi:hypothetical protein